MAMESPIRIVETTDKWPPLKQPSRFASSSSAKIAIEDLGFFMKGQRFQSPEKDAIPSRSGSAPPSMEGSIAAINYMFSQQKTASNPNAKCVNGSVVLPPKNLPAHEEESDDDGSSQHCGSLPSEKVVLSDCHSDSAGSTQEIPHRPSSPTRYQSRSSIYKSNEEAVVSDCNTRLLHKLAAVTNAPSSDDVRQVSVLHGAEDTETRTNLRDGDPNSVEVDRQENLSMDGINDVDSDSVDAEKRVDISSASSSYYDKFQRKEQFVPHNIMLQQQAVAHESSSSRVLGSYSEMIYPGISNSYGSPNQFHYGSAAGFMTSPFYPNLHAGFFTPQYGMGGYIFNSAVLPSYVAGFPSHCAVPLAFNSSSFPSSGVLDGGNVHAYDMQNLQKFYSQVGVPTQSSFSDSFHMQVFQPPTRDFYGKYGHFGHQAPAVVNMKKGTDPDSFSHDRKSPQSAAAGYKSLNVRRGNPTNVSPPLVQFPLVQFPGASTVSSVVSSKPAGEANFPGERYNISNSHSSGNRSRTYGLQSQSWNDKNSYSFLEELKMGRGQKVELSDIAGHISEFSVDQHGSRFIQQKLETCSVEEKASVFQEVVPHASKLMTDVFGNYVIQKLFDYGSWEQRKALANQLEGQILPLSLQMYGCRVIQKAIDVIDLEQKARLVRELDGHVIRCVRDQNGNHVVQKCIESIPTDKIHFIISSFRGQVATLAMHPYGCRVIQRVLEHCKDELQIQFIVDEILDSVGSLAQDQYGNYVTQHVLERGKPHERSKIIEKLSGSVVQLSQHKFASNVMEKCLEYCDSTARGALIKKIVGHGDKSDDLLIMMKDQYANYVIQKILLKCTSDEREMLLGLIRNHLASLKKYTYGKHIIARFEELYGEEVQASDS